MSVVCDFYLFIFVSGGFGHPGWNGAPWGGPHRQLHEDSSEPGRGLPLRGRVHRQQSNASSHCGEQPGAWSEHNYTLKMQFCCRNLFRNRTRIWNKSLTSVVSSRSQGQVTTGQKYTPACMESKSCLQCSWIGSWGVAMKMRRDGLGALGVSSLIFAYCMCAGMVYNWVWICFCESKGVALNKTWWTAPFGLWVVLCCKQKSWSILVFCLLVMMVW